MDFGWNRMASCNKLKALNAFSTGSWENCIWPCLFNIQISHNHWLGKIVLDVSVEERLCLGWMSLEGNCDTRGTSRVTKLLVILLITKKKCLSVRRLEFPACLTCVFLDGGRKPEDSEWTHANTGEWPGDRTRVHLQPCYEVWGEIKSRNQSSTFLRAKNKLHTVLMWHKQSCRGDGVWKCVCVCPRLWKKYDSLP